MAIWQVANDWGIRIKADVGDTSFFNAGHIEDILRLEDGQDAANPITLIAAETSGAWKVFPDTDQKAVPLSLDWDWVNLHCLLNNPTEAHHIYAGGQALHMSDLSLSEPLDHFVEITIQNAAGTKLPFLGINRMTILPVNADIKNLVLACDGGIFWARIPGGASTKYDFTQARVTNAAGDLIDRFSSVATLKVSSSAGDVNLVVAAGQDLGTGLFIGQFIAGNLQFQPLPDSTIPTGFSQTKMQRPILAVTPAQPNLLYVVSGNSQDGMYCVLRGTLEADLNWAFAALSNKVAGITKPLFGDDVKGSDSLAGGQVDWNVCIAVSQTDIEKVAVGWQNGYFVLQNGGMLSEDWKFIPASMDHLHEDFHALLFGRDETIYLGSDGGLALTRDIGTTHSSLANRHLPNFQVYNISVNPESIGMVATALQDNGSAVSNLYPAGQPWAKIHGADGFFVQFLRDDRLLDLTGSFGLKAEGIKEQTIDDFSVPSRGPGITSDVGLIPVEGVAGSGLGQVGDPENGVGAVRERYFDLLWPYGDIDTPTWKNDAGKVLVSAAADSVSGKIYGLLKGTEARDLSWSLFVIVPINTVSNERVSCLDSPDGGVIFVGTDQGKIFQLTPHRIATATTWSQTQMVQLIPSLPGSSVTKILQLKAHAGQQPLAIATESRILQLQGAAWVDLNSPARTMIPPPPHDFREEYTGLDTNGLFDRPASNIFLCTDRRIFQSTDMSGTTWNDISSGLPLAPHCRDIRFQHEAAGLDFLYLATYGWSTWRRQMNTSTQAHARNVNLSGQDVSITFKHFPTDVIGSFRIPAATMNVGTVHPIAENVYRTPQVEDSWAQFKLRCEYRSDDSVRVKFEVMLNNTFTGGQDVKKGKFELAPGDTEKRNVRTEIEDYTCDLNMIVTN